MIVLWGLPGDGPVSAVRAALRARAIPHLLLDQRAVGACTIEFSPTSDGCGELTVGSQSIDLTSISAVYVRPYDLRTIFAVGRKGSDSPEMGHAVRFEAAFVTWLELAYARVINQPSMMSSNNSKTFQATLIRRAGFATPETLVTTDPEVARRFQGDHEAVIYKSVSGIRSVVAVLSNDDHGRLSDVEWCPTQFQEFVPGVDYRVHVAGTQTFVTRIRSSAIDYRYASRSGGETRLEPACLPDDVLTRCVTLTATMRLFVSGIDLRVRPDGAVYCFEVNPSPGFTYFEDATNQPISDSVADLLAAQ